MQLCECSLILSMHCSAPLRGAENPISKRSCIAEERGVVRQMYLFTQDVRRGTVFFNAAATTLHSHDQSLHMKHNVLRYRQICTDFKSSLQTKIYRK